VINHSRTLLLNESPAGRPDVGTYGEEYIPDGFQPQQLPGFLSIIREHLLGTFGDPLYQNYRIAQYMSILQANIYSVLAVILPDSRITYEPGSGLFEWPFGITSSEINTLGMGMQVIGLPKASDTIGRSKFSWVLTTLSGSKVQTDDVIGKVTEEHDLTVADTLTNVFPMRAKGGSMEGRITAPTGLVSDGAIWTVEATARPETTLGAIMTSSGQLGEDTLTQLFTGVPESFKNLWGVGESLVDRFGGFLGAVIWQLEQVRTNG